MAVGFGFSVSDICMALKVIKDSVNALDKTKGSPADFATLVCEVQCLEDGLLAIQDLLEDANLRDQQSAALQRAVSACNDIIREFLKSISKYQTHLTHESTGLSSAYRKVKWAVCKKDDVERFRSQLSRQASSINMLLITVQAKQQRDFNRSKSTENAVARIEGTQDSSLLDMMSSMSTEHRQCFLMIMQQNNELMQTVRDMRHLLLTQRAMPPQILLQPPVRLLDPFGKVAPFHLEFVESSECFMAVLKARFAHAGVKTASLLKLDKHEFIIENTRTQKPVDLEKRWNREWQPGEQYDMRMIFHRFVCPPSTCPSCHETNDGSETQVYCHGCGLEYENVQAINQRSQDWDANFPSNSDVKISGDDIPYLLRHPERKAELKVFHPLKESEDEIFEVYRRVQIVSQSLALLDTRFPALMLIEDFIRFADLVREVSPGVSPYEGEILDLSDRAQIYIREKQSNLPPFSSYSFIAQKQKGLTKASKYLRQDIDILVRKLCEDPSTADLMTLITQREFWRRLRISSFC